MVTVSLAHFIKNLVWLPSLALKVPFRRHSSQVLKKRQLVQHNRRRTSAGAGGGILIIAYLTSFILAALVRKYR